MKLVIDTSSLCTLVFICSDEWKVSSFELQNATQTQDEAGMASHNEALSVLANSLLQKSSDSLSEIVIGVGPGSFTGIRIGLSFAIGLGIGNAVPIRTLSSMVLYALLMRPALSDGIILQADARRSEFFLSAFDSDGKVVLAEQIVPESYIIEVRNKHSSYKCCTIDDPQWEVSLRNTLTKIRDEGILLDQLGLLGRTYQQHEYPQIEPLYLREVAARTIKERGIDAQKP